MSYNFGYWPETAAQIIRLFGVVSGIKDLFEYLVMQPATKFLLIACLSTSACTTTPALWDDYQSYPENKAFAMGSNGVSGAAWSMATVEQAMHAAESYCVSHGGVSCEVIDVNGGPPGVKPLATARIKPSGGKASQAPGTGENPRYDCGTYSDGVLVELPVAPLNAEVGEVTIVFHGEEIKAIYVRNGLNQFWYLTDAMYIELTPTMMAYYWDFTGAEEGEKRSSEATFTTCTKRGG